MYRKHIQTHNSPPSAGKLLPAAIILLVAAVFIVAYCFSPETHAFYPPCPFKKLTGYNCPGCGAARAFHSLLHGRLLAAADYNLLFLPAVPVIASGLLAAVSGKENHIWHYCNRPALTCMIFIIFWVLRNLPWEPFLWLNADK